MKKVIYISLINLFLLVSATVLAGMTDSQVIAFAKKELKAGTSQAQIVTKLMQKGVDISQIRRVRDKYQKEMNGSEQELNDDDTKKSSNTGEGLRVNNGDTKEDIALRKLNNATKKQQQKSSASSLLANSNNSGNSNMKGEIAKKEEALYQGHKVFGRDIFNRDDLTFEPVMNIATPQNYVIGPGDEVKVDIYGASQDSNTYTVSPDGDITIDGYGPVNLSGLSVSQANTRLRSTLGSRYSSSSIKMTVGQTRTISVNVVGEVRTPGTFTLSAFASVFHALYMAEGVNEIGTLRNIKVYRRGRLISTVDVYDYLLNGKLTGNVRLADGDVIVVGPFDSMVDISGKVKRPMFYEMKKTESLSTLMKYAGGFASGAYTKTVRVRRSSGAKRSIFNIGEFDMTSFRMADGDMVSVDSILDRYENMVEVRGAVFRPGMYQLGGEITTVRSLLEHCDGVTEDAFTAHGVIHRMNANRTLRVISVDVQGILNGYVPDIALENEDVLFIPSKTVEETNRTITIHGEVQFPGIYPYADNETLEDFVLQAGGLKEAASTVKVDVARRIRDPYAFAPDSVVAKTFTFALKEGFVVDGVQGFVLQPYDEVYVRRSPGYSTQQNVVIEGNVNFPGTYALNKRNSRLSDIVMAAGGTNGNAYIKGARLERRITPEERIRMNQVLKMSQLNNGSDTIDVRKLNIGDTYYVGIQLDKALANKGSDYDIVLREGDHIIVPEYTNTVKVSGNVLYPNTVAYVKGKSASYYINQAGGYDIRARKGSTYIVHMNGTVNQVGKGEKPTPGSEIIVPTKPKSDPAKISQWLAIGTSAATLATTIATIANLIKK